MKTSRVCVIAGTFLLPAIAAAAPAAGAQSVYSSEVTIRVAIADPVPITPADDTGYPRLAVSYELQVPSLAPGETDAVAVNTATWLFTWQCANRTPSQWTLTTASYTRPVTTTAWYPSAGKAFPTGAQATLPIPNDCNGGPVALVHGAAFTTTFSATLPKPVTFRWHYAYCTSTATCTAPVSSGSSTVTPSAGGIYPPPPPPPSVQPTATVLPTASVLPTATAGPPHKGPLPFTGLELGTLIGAAAVVLATGTVLVGAARRRRRPGLHR